MNDKKPLYVVTTLNGYDHFTHESPDTWEEITEGWRKYWVRFKNTDGRTVELNPDLIVGIRYKGGLQ